MSRTSDLQNVRLGLPLWHATPPSTIRSPCCLPNGLEVGVKELGARVTKLEMKSTNKNKSASKSNSKRKSKSTSKRYE